jgi:folate-binding Fe-S cluster repair protein YgfZ
MWWSSSSGRIELQMTAEQAASVSHQGRCDDDVKALRQVPKIRRQLDKIDPELLRAELKEYGAWDANELADHEDNLDRILWIPGCDIREEEYAASK